MNEVLQFFGALVLLATGLRLSAFYSGSEIGFYRVSSLRLSIDANFGDPEARRLLWFTQNPAYFVATVLVGNNVANYLTTLAIGLGMGLFLSAGSDWFEIAGAVLFSPIVFIIGELVPKQLYYAAPTRLLRSNVKWFVLSFRAFFVISFPLIGLSKWFERFGAAENEPRELVLGRKRLIHVLSRGRQEGLLTDVQGRLVHGLLHTAEQSVRSSMTPVNRILGISDDVSSQEALDFAARFGLSVITVRSPDSPNGWYGYIRASDLTLRGEAPRALIREMPRLPAAATKLEAMLALRDSAKALAVVTENEDVLGIVSERGLIEQLFRVDPGAGPLVKPGQETQTP